VVHLWKVHAARDHIRPYQNVPVTLFEVVDCLVALFHGAMAAKRKY
jgi:hypothetical protein